MGTLVKKLFYMVKLLHSHRKYSKKPFFRRSDISPFYSRNLSESALNHNDNGLPSPRLQVGPIPYHSMLHWHSSLSAPLLSVDLWSLSAALQPCSSVRVTWSLNRASRRKDSRTTMYAPSPSIHAIFSDMVPVGTYRPHHILWRFPLWTNHHKVVPVLIPSPVPQPNEEGHLQYHVRSKYRGTSNGRVLLY